MALERIFTLEALANNVLNSDQLVISRRFVLFELGVAENTKICDIQYSLRSDIKLFCMEKIGKSVTLVL